MCTELLQPEFPKVNRQPGLIPAWDPLTRILNLILIDLFQNHFENLRNAIERKREKTRLPSSKL